MPSRTRMTYVLVVALAVAVGCRGQEKRDETQVTQDSDSRVQESAKPDRAPEQQSPPPQQKKRLYRFSPLVEDKDKCPSDMKAVMAKTADGEYSVFVDCFVLTAEDIPAPETGCVEFTATVAAAPTTLRVFIEAKLAWEYDDATGGFAESGPVSLEALGVTSDKLKLRLSVGGQFPSGGGIQFFAVDQIPAPSKGK